MTRKQTMKVYHGVPKSITDEYTLFYKETPYTETLLNMPTGYGSRTTGATATTKYASPSEITVDFWLYAKNLKSSASGWLSIVNSVDSQEERQFAVVHDQCNLFVFYPNFNWNNGYKVPLNQYTHVRVTCTNNKVTIYINGKVYFTNTSTGFNPSATIKRLYMLSGSHDALSEIYLADIHVSTIDRGDYFPNLPKDFIEGKAVIKPRMGQQQIKGDPMYSQVTNLKVEAFTGVEYPTLIDSNYYRHRYYPELSAKGANHWNAGSSFRIRGLTGEVISGVIDTDTALCKVVSMVDATNIVVDSVKALAVGDTVKWLNTTNHIVSTATATITEIDSATKRISFTGDFVDSGIIGMYVVETTASSSSPTVKTLDGTNVVGTWSGLGTNEATFTLGENTDIKGKDLYVEYSLTMPYGNSDFPEIPYEIERAWGENGVEMTPVDRIIIVDDFKDKIIGDVTECPHFMGWHFGSTLKNPDTFSENDKQAYYTLISSLDGTIRECSTTDINQVPQQIFRFNLIEVIERKLGCEIPNRDKIQWLKDNISYLGLRWYGYGSNYQGNKAQCEVYLVDSQTYTSTGKSNTTSTVSLCQLDVNSSTVGRVIDNNGYVSFIAFTTATDGSTPSRICTDYVVLDMILKHDSNYTPLYCSNKRAREDKCNPVLIQKETKTVKRYLPSKEYFVTENTKLPYKDVAKAETGQILCVLPHKIVTTNGTTTLTQGNNGVDNYTDKIVLPSGYNPYNFDSSPIRVSETDETLVSHTVQLPIIRYWGGRKHHGVGATASGLDSCQTITTVTDKEGKQQYEMYAGLKNINGELIMVIRTDVRFPNNAVPPSTYTNIDYKLPNRPLIK